MRLTKLLDGLIISAIVMLALIVLSGNVDAGMALDRLGLTQAEQPAAELAWQPLDTGRPGAEVPQAIRDTPNAGRADSQPQHRGTMQLPDLTQLTPGDVAGETVDVPEVQVQTVPRDTSFEEIVSVFDGVTVQGLQVLNPRIDPSAVPAGQDVRLPATAQYNPEKARALYDQAEEARRATIVENAVRGDSLPLPGESVDSADRDWSAGAGPDYEYKTYDATTATTVEESVRDRAYSGQQSVAEPAPTATPAPLHTNTTRATIVENAVRNEQDVPAQSDGVEGDIIIEDAVRAAIGR